MVNVGAYRVINEFNNTRASILDIPNFSMERFDGQEFIGDDGYARARSKRISRTSPWNLLSTGSTSRRTHGAKKTKERSGEFIHPFVSRQATEDSNEASSDYENVVTEPCPAKICTHCGITETPQWREGPLGPRTLCNACGMRYRSGRLYPEYRPARSPTFVPSVHSNSHKKVIEMRTNGKKVEQPRLYLEYRSAASPTFVPSLHSNSHKKVIEMRTNSKKVEQPLWMPQTPELTPNFALA